MPLPRLPKAIDIGRFEYDVLHDRWTWSHELRALHGLGPQDSPTTAVLLQHMVPEDRSVMYGRFLDHLAHAGPYSCSYTLIDALARRRKVVFVGESEARAGRVARLHGFVVDISEELRDATGAALAASLEHRAVIEQAKGALMLTFGVEEDVAFHILRSYSNRHNVKLAEVAARLVTGLSDPDCDREHPVESVLGIVSTWGSASPVPRPAARRALRPDPAALARSGKLSQAERL